LRVCSVVGHRPRYLPAGTTHCVHAPLRAEANVPRRSVQACPTETHVCVCVRACVRACVRMCMRAYCMLVYVRVYVLVHVCAPARACSNTRTCAFAHARAILHVYMHVRVRARIRGRGRVCAGAQCHGAGGRPPLLIEMRGWHDREAEVVVGVILPTRAGFPTSPPKQSLPLVAFGIRPNVSARQPPAKPRQTTVRTLSA
jgi:hypothetical protein